MKKQFYKVPLVKPSQRLQKQRQPEWKVCNFDDSEFKCGTGIRNVNNKGCKWEYKSNSNNKGRTNKKGKGEVRNRFQKERISYEMVKSKSIGRVIKSRECARLNKEMFDNKDDEEIKMVFYNVGGVRTKAMKNPLELNGVRINSGNVSVNENENECDDVLEKEKSVLKYNNNESNFIDNLNRVFETSKNGNEVSCNNYNNIKVKDEDYDDIHNYMSKPIDIDNNNNDNTNMKDIHEYNKQEYVFDNDNDNNYNPSNLLDSNYVTKLSNINDDTYNKYKYNLQHNDLQSYTKYNNNIDSLSQGQIHTYNDFQPKITSNEYNTNNTDYPNIFNSTPNPQGNSNPFQQYNPYNINNNNNISQTNLNDINTLLSQTATTADKLSTNLPETSLQYKYQYSGNKLIYKYN